MVIETSVAANDFVFAETKEIGAEIKIEKKIMQIFVKKLSREQIEVTENLQDTNWYEKSGFKRAQGRISWIWIIF